MSAAQPQTRIHIWFRWIAVNTASLAVAFFGMAVLFGLSRQPSSHVGLTAVALALALLVGGLMGVLQWAILREFISSPRSWISLTIAAWGLSMVVGILLRWATLDGPGEETYLLPSLLLFALACGTLIGAAQWFILRKYVPRAGWWVLANIAGLLLGVPFFFALGLPYGALTGAALVYLLRLPPS